jgi:hypothetical protein
MKKIEASLICPCLECNIDYLVHCCGIGDQVVNPVGNETFEHRDKNWSVVTCPKNFNKDESGVPCFSAGPQARRREIFQKPFNQFKEILRIALDELVQQRYIS